MTLSTSASLADLDPRYTPHGHTALDARRERRLLVRVTIRPGQMGQMLPDGRAYASGTHTIQIYESDLPNLEALLETREDLVAQAGVLAAEKTVEWCAAYRAEPTQCPINLPAEFRLLKRDRDMLPVSKIEQLGELDDVRTAQARVDDDRVRRGQTTPEQMASAMVGALRDAGLVAAPKAK